MKRIKALKTALLVALCATTVGGVSAIQSVQASEIRGADDLFVNANGVTVTEAASAPEQFLDYKGKTIERDFDIGMEGVLLSAEKIGSKVELSQTFSGDFSMSFRAYSDVSFGSDNKNEFNAYNYVMTPYADLREISFIFEDEEGQSFTVAIAAGEKYNVITPAARVICGNLAFGYHYLNDADVENNTANQNAAGYYTRLSGSTFCNVAMLAGQLTSENSKPVTFGFNASEMEIYVMHYGRVTEQETYRVVADLDNEIMGISKFNRFGDYKVTVQFTDIADGKDANVIVYDINGQSLAGETFTDDMGANTSVKKGYDGVKGEKYYIPEAKAFDLFDGVLDFNGTVKVNKGTVPVYTAEGVETDVWTEGCYFLPEKTGTYTVGYQAKDTKGNLGTVKSISVNVVSTLPEWSYDVEGNYLSLERGENVYSVGGSISLYPVKAISSLLLSDNVAYMNATLLKDGVVYKGIENQKITETTEVKLEDAGEYKLVYGVGAYPELMKKEYTFTVSENAPLFTLNSELPSVVKYGDTFTVPKATATLAGNKTLAASSLYAPDGSLVSLSGGKATIEQVGMYKISYLVRFGNATYTYVTYFEAAHYNGGAFVSTSELVTAEYGDTGSMFANVVNGSKLTYIGVDAYAEYTRTIDLSKLTKNDPLIKLLVIPSKTGVLDFWQYTIRLTDVHDIKNYVDIQVFKGSWGNQWSYVKAGAANQKPAGWEMGKVLTNYNAGAPINHSFTGESAAGTENIVLYYDYADNAVLVDNIKRPGYAYGNEVIDLDGTDCFNENSLFQGFTTGEVKLSISIQNLQLDQAQLLVTEVNGIDMGQKWLNDTVAPRIGVDLQGYTESELPVGLVNVAYPIFQATAFDSAEGVSPVTTKVYKNYQTSTQEEIAIENGKFVPDAAGKYTIVYSTTDKSGNKSSKTLAVTVENALPAFTYTFNKELKTEYKLGEYMYVASGVAAGGSGRAQAVVKVYDTKGNLIEEPNGMLIEQQGAYSVCVEFTDYLGRTHTTTYTITASISAAPIVYEVSMPKAYVNGVSYVLPAFNAVDYSTGSFQEPEKNIKVVYDGKETVVGADRSFTPNVKKHQDTIQVIYSAKNAKGEVTEMTYTVVVLIVSSDAGLDMSAYFALTDMAVSEKTDSYVEFVTDTDGAKMDFVNPLIANNLNMEVYVPKAKNNFATITVTLTDSLDSTIAKSFVIQKNTANKNTSILLCEGEKLDIAGNFFDLTSYGLSVRYNNTSRYLFDRNANVNLIRFATDDNGEAFTGFPSGKVYLSFTLGGVEDVSALRIMLIGNQNFSNLTNDRVLPQIQLSSFIARSGEINKIFVVPSAIAADVLSAEVTLKVTVKKGSNIIYEGPINKDYAFRPGEYGKYRIEYTASAGGRSATSAYFVDIKDRINPTLTLNGTMPTTAVLGQAMQLPTATVADNYTEEMRVWIYITEPTGRMITLEEGVTTYTPTMKGKHRISYYVHDEYANYAYAKYTVTVQ